MRKSSLLVGLAILSLAAVLVVGSSTGEEPTKPTAPGAKSTDKKETPLDSRNLPAPGPIPTFIGKALGWLAEAQHSDGGWGAGMHAKQDVKDPSKVQVDPATTAFAALALMRAGNTTTSGDYRGALRKATEYLVKTVEAASESGPKITDITGTQPQTKLGPIVDTSLTAQYLARILPTLASDDSLRPRVDAALSKCLAKLESAQAKDGSWNSGGGWAPVLQSSLSCSALEVAASAGKKVDPLALESARRYQRGNVDAKTGRAGTAAGAGVELYGFSSGQKANASGAMAAKRELARAKVAGKLEAEAAATAENFAKAGLGAEESRQLADAATRADAQARRLNDPALLRGFGNNGGEEFLSYLLTSESLVIFGGDDWTKWNSKMHEQLAKVQNPDGSYSGHHCISSPVFCTAAVIQCVTTDRDATVLFTIAEKSRAKLNPAQEAALEARLAEGRKAQPVQAAQRPGRSVEAAPVESTEADLLKSPPRESRRRK